MPTNTLLSIVAAGFAVLLTHPAAAQTAALAGQVTSAEEGSMEGVVISARKDGSNITYSVVSDDKGHFSFPSAKLEPGHYTLAARAAGYDLDGPKAADIAAGQARQRRYEAQEDEESSASTDQCRMDAQRPRHRGPEDQSDQLRELPYGRAYRAFDTRCRRVRAGDDAHGELCAGQPADQAAGAHGAVACRQSGKIPQDGGMARYDQFERGAVAIPAQDAAARKGPRHPRADHRIRSTAQDDRAARRHRRCARSGLVLEFRRDVPRQARSEHRQGERNSRCRNTRRAIRPARSTSSSTRPATSGSA